jgi:site-specific DNA-methyltransferase (adenine-specific)
MLTITNEDCMDMMARYPDRHFDLAVVDPPYGIGADSAAAKKRHGYVGSRIIPSRVWELKNWDIAPPQRYFDELFRVSSNQIIWGGNYFMDKIKRNSSCWIAWDKQCPDGLKFADAELAWTSFKTRTRLFSYAWIGFSQGILGASTSKNKEHRIHPTQKPVKLYKWLLGNYAKPGQRILDTHMGSGSIAIACHDLGFDLTACELDADYFNAAMERIEAHRKQGTLFDNKELTAANF